MANLHRKDRFDPANTYKTEPQRQAACQCFGREGRGTVCGKGTAVLDLRHVQLPEQKTQLVEGIQGTKWIQRALSPEVLHPADTVGEVLHESETSPGSDRDSPS